jgi:hypothetical protein
MTLGAPIHYRHFAKSRKDLLYSMTTKTAKSTETRVFDFRIFAGESGHRSC